ncbi:unnamed protein product, partial [Ectocarpus sp. 13 AM-2016]
MASSGQAAAGASDTSGHAAAVDRSSVGTALLLLEALVGHGVLSGEHVFGCVTTAAFCLCESVPTDLRVALAGVAVLDTVLSRRSRDGGGRG